MADEQVRLRLVTEAPNCFLCVHHIDLVSSTGVGSWCGLLVDEIHSEHHAAMECGEYRRDPDAS